MDTRFLIIASLIYAHAAHAQSANRTCYWYGFRAGEVNGSLYIYGGTRFDVPWTKGQALQHGNTGFGGSDTAWSTNVFTMNYSVGFDVSEEPPDLDSLLQAKTLGSRQDFPGSTDGAIISSTIEFYMFGGLGYVEKMKDTLVNYQVIAEPGQATFSEGPKTNYRLPANSHVSNAVALGSAASVPVDDQRQAFYFSGMHTRNSTLLSHTDLDELVPAHSLIIADLSDQGEATWENLTLPTEVPARARSQLVWVPKGPKGLLVAIGGIPYPGDVAASSKVLDLAQLPANEAIGDAVMKTVSVFDIETRIWYQQNTTGDVPRSLEGFCAVLAQQDGASTMEIFIYGGMHANTERAPIATAQDAVYALSLPSFTWVKVNEGKAAHGRTEHACTKPLPNQMLIFGGFPGDASCIKDYSTLDIFNLNTLEWTRKYDPSSYEAYKTPRKITNMVLSNAGEVFVNETLKKLFNTPYSRAISTTLPEAHQPTQNQHLGAIVGGSIAGALFLILAVGVLWFCRPAKRQAHRQRDSIVSVSGTAPILRWLKGTQQLGSEPKSVLSDATTEVDSVPNAIAKPPAELDARARATSLATVPQAELEEGSFSGTLHPSVAYTTSPPLRSRSRSPSSRQSESVEAAGAVPHEVHGESKPLPRPPRVPETTASQSPTYMTAHHMYPWNIDWNSSGPRERHDLGSIDQGPLRPSLPADHQPSRPDPGEVQTNSKAFPSENTHSPTDPDQSLTPKANSSIQATPIDLLLQLSKSAEAFPRLSSDPPDGSSPPPNAVPFDTAKRESIVSPIIPRQDSLRGANDEARHRPHFSSMSSSVSGIEDLPTSVVVVQQSQPRTPVESLARVIGQADSGEEGGKGGDSDGDGAGRGYTGGAVQATVWRSPYRLA